MESLPTVIFVIKLGMILRGHRKIQYPLISDNTFSISRSFEVLREEEGRAERGTFVIDPDGVIKVWNNLRRSWS